MSYEEMVKEHYPKAYFHFRHEYMPHSIFSGNDPDKCVGIGHGEGAAWVDACNRLNIDIPTKVYETFNPNAHILNNSPI